MDPKEAKKALVDWRKGEKDSETKKPAFKTNAPNKLQTWGEAHKKTQPNVRKIKISDEKFLAIRNSMYDKAFSEVSKATQHNPNLTKSERAEIWLSSFKNNKSLECFTSDIAVKEKLERNIEKELDLKLEKEARERKFFEENFIELGSPNSSPLSESLFASDCDSFVDIRTPTPVPEISDFTIRITNKKVPNTLEVRI